MSKQREDEIKRIMVKMLDISSEAMINTALEAHGTLVSNPPKGTPIDTSYASSKWWYAVTTLPARTDDDCNVSAAKAKQQQTLQSVLDYDVSQGSIFVFNDTQYIGRLNAGHSKQSPSMFVEDAVDSAVAETNHRYAAGAYTL